MKLVQMYSPEFGTVSMKSKTCSVELVTNTVAPETVGTVSSK